MRRCYPFFQGLLVSFLILFNGASVEADPEGSCPLRVGDRFALDQVAKDQGGANYESLEVLQVTPVGVRTWNLELRVRLPRGTERIIQASLSGDPRLAGLFRLHSLTPLERGVFGKLRVYASLGSSYFTASQLDQGERIQILNSLNQVKSLGSHLMDLIMWRNVPYPESITGVKQLRLFVGDYRCRRTVSHVISGPSL